MKVWQVWLLTMSSSYLQCPTKETAPFLLFFNKPSSYFAPMMLSKKVWVDPVSWLDPNALNLWIKSLTDSWSNGLTAGKSLPIGMVLKQSIFSLAPFFVSLLPAIWEWASLPHFSMACFIGQPDKQQSHWQWIKTFWSCFFLRYLSRWQQNAKQNKNKQTKEKLV